MPDERVHELMLRYRIDKAAAHELLDGIRQFQAHLLQLREAARGVGQGASAIPSALQRIGSSRDVDRLRQQVQKAADDFKQLRAETLKANEAIGDTADIANKAARATNQAATAKGEAAIYGQTARNLTAYGSLVSRVGGAGAGQGLMLASDISDATRAAKMMRAELPKLADQLGIGTLALGGFGVGIAAIAVTIAYVKDQLNKAEEEGRKKAQALIDTNREYSEIVATGTTESIQAVMAVKDEEIKQKELERDRLEQTIVSIASASDELVLFHGKLMELSTIAKMGGIEALKEVLDLGPLGVQWEQLNTEISNNTSLNDQLTQAQQEGATAAADLAVQEQALAQARLGIVERDTQRALNEANLGKLSAEQAQARLDEDKRQRDIYLKAGENIQVMLETMRPSDEGYQEAAASLEHYWALIDGLNYEIDQLSTVYIPAAKATEDQAKAIQFATGAFGALTGQLTKSGEAAAGLVDFERETAARRLEIMAAFEEEAARITAQRALQTARDEEDAARKRFKDQTRFAYDLAESDRQYYDQRSETIQKSIEEAGAAGQEQLKALADFNREDIRRVEDHERRLLQIRRDTGKAVRNAAAQLDAASVVQLLESGGEQIDAENDQYGLEKKRRDEDWADRLDEMGNQRQEKLKAGQQALSDLNVQHQRERNSKISAFNDQLREEDQERALRRSRQQQDWSIEDNLRQQRAMQQLNQVSGFQSREAALYDAHHASLLGKVDTFYRDLTSKVPTGAAAAASHPAAQAKSGRVVKYAGGGNPVPGAVVKVGESGSEYAQFMGPWSIYSHGSQKPGINVTIPFAPGAITVQGGANGPLDILQLQRGLEGGVRSIVLKTLTQFFQESS